MNKIFCSNCGAKVEFSTTKPNFCFKCGDSLSALAKVTNKKVPTPSSPDDDDDIDEEDEDDSEELLTSRKISLNVEFAKTPLTIAQAWANPVQPAPDKVKTVVPKNAGRKALKALRERVVSKDPIEIN